MGDAEQSVSHADRSGDAFWKLASRCKIADALHQLGRRIEAEGALPRGYCCVGRAGRWLGGPGGYGKGAVGLSLAGFRVGVGAPGVTGTGEGRGRLGYARSLGELA